MKKIRTKKSNVAIGAATVCAVLVGLAAWQLGERYTATETIVVATHYIPPFTDIERADVKTVLVPKNTGIAGMEADPKKVLGHYGMFPIPAEYPVTDTAMNSSSSFSSFLTQYERQTGQRGTELFLNASTQAEKLVEPGEQVELLVPGTDARGIVDYNSYVVRVLNVLGTPAQALGLFIPDSISTSVTSSILSGSVQVALISQKGTYTTAPSEASSTAPPTPSAAVVNPASKPSQTDNGPLSQMTAGIPAGQTSTQGNQGVTGK